jgi:dolichol kinase
MSPPGDPAAGWLRPGVHAATGFLALTLGVLPDAAVLAAALLGLVAGWIVFPRVALGRRLARPGEPFLGGLRTYPVAVLLLVLLLPRAEAAAAWGVLAFGDGAAALVGRRVPAPSVFGHPKATWSGTAALLAAFGLGVAVGALGASVPWVEPGAAPGLGRCAFAALAAALIDLVPIPPDDNLPCAAVAGAVLRATR